MVRAILAGTKTQTRRAAKLDTIPQHAEFSGWQDHRGRPAAMFSWPGEDRDQQGRVTSTFRGGLCCPYGQPGDRLWVRETYFAFGRWETRFSAKKWRDEWHFVDMTLECDRAYQYDADGAPQMPVQQRRNAGVTPGWWKRPAIFMPRAASRITLEVTGVRVERLQEISEADAIAEGIEPNWLGDLAVGNNGFGGQGWTPDNGWKHYTNSIDGDPAFTPEESYRSLWESINGAGSWDANPWVWVVEFRKDHA
jgi:hypothetical protein